MKTIAAPWPMVGPKSWLICGVAAAGFVFDIYEIVVQPLLVRPVLLDLGGLQPGTPDFNRWAGWLYMLPPMTGGVLGLLGGYLTDLLGRRRVLVGSIALYCIGAVGAGFSSSLPELLFWRCITIAGVCVEFVQR